MYFGTVRLYKLLLMKLILGYCRMVLVFHLLCSFFLFGDTSKSSRGDVINLILLQIKQYIFNCKNFEKKIIIGHNAEENTVTM
jgi:hypothetical protein